MSAIVASLVTAVRVPLAQGPPPWAAVQLVDGDADPVVLVGRWAGVRAIVASEPVATAPAGVDPFDLLDAQPRVEGDPLVRVGGGWFGHLGYQLGRAVEPAVGPPPVAPRTLPAATLAFHDHVLVLDDEGHWWFEALQTRERAGLIGERLAEFRERLTRPVRPVEPRAAVWHPVPRAAGHRAAVVTCRERIHAGDLFQANVALRLGAQGANEPADLFALGVRALEPDRAAYVAGSWGAVASLSPELFLERRGREVRSAPIKGTRPRGEDPRAAEALRDELEASAKDRAENVMIVDLVRNDLGRVCEPGSVHVPSLGVVEAHTGVWHLVSVVAGTLREDVGDGDLVRAAFPPGSVTGAPKVAAMDVIYELESTARQAYTGSVGFASPIAGLELNVAIRTFEFAGDEAWLHVGGGIVADSDPMEEARECLVKAAPLLRAMDGRVDDPAVARDLPGDARRPPRWGPQPLHRPDPAHGLLETIRVRDGRAQHVASHLARLAAAARAVYGIEIDSDPAIVHEAAAGAGEDARVRLVLELPDGAAHLTATPAPPGAPGPPALEPVVVPGGIGAYKWADRRLLTALGDHVAPAIPLLVDLDGLVLEAAIANVLVAPGDGRIVTPPLDGRILPGTARARVLDRARARGITVDERPIGLDELLDAGAVAITSSLRELQLVVSVAGRPASAEGGVFAGLLAG